jgi:hypothetical protein
MIVVLAFNIRRQNELVIKDLFVRWNLNIKYLHLNLKMSSTLRINSLSDQFLYRLIVLSAMKFKCKWT